MSKISITSALQSRRRLRLATFLASAVLLVALGQLIITNSPKDTQARVVDGWTVDDTATVKTCTITSASSHGIPSVCEGYNIIIVSGTVLADTVKVKTVNGVATACTDSNDIDCDSKRKFNSLKLQSGAILEHTALTIADMAEDTAAYGSGSSANKSLADNKIGAARWKKVDLEVAGAFTLEGTAKINVTEKGYPKNLWTPGDSSTWSVIYPNGHGRGFGVGYAFDNTNGGNAGGGGYGGRGGQSIPSTTDASVTYGDKDLAALPEYFEWGSSGGTLCGDCHNGVRADGSYIWDTPAYQGVGGSGGGRIRIDAGSISIASGASVLANGGNGTTVGSANGGGGAGGSIVLVYREQASNLIPTAQIADSKVGQTFSSGGGPTEYCAPYAGVTHCWTNPLYTAAPTNASAGTIYQADTLALVTSPDSSVNTNIQAKGGARAEDNTDYINGASGGGGRIYLKRTGAGGGLSISKKLIAVNRPTATPVTSFNPYALQIGDLIKVELTIGSPHPAISNLKDEFLSAPKPGGGLPTMCVYDTSRGAASNGGSQVGTSITWGTVLANNTSSPTVRYYYCRVQ